MYKLALAIFATTAVLAFPSAAGAAYSGTVNGTTATLTGDDAPDNLAIGVDSGNLTHNRPQSEGFASSADFDSTANGDQTVPANGSLTISAGGGDDAVAFAAAVDSLAASTIDGEAGDDLLSGSAGTDAIRGGDGNDRVIGFRGGDDLEGGAGNDQLVWNNGDGSDVMDGDAGNDEVEVNGAPTAGDTFTVSPSGARVAFARTNLGPFTLDVSAERMTLNGLGGADTMTGAEGLAPLILVGFHGGPGPDALTGGDGPDFISGGEGIDGLAGGGGDDRVVGDRGDDVMSGGNGDDTLVWNNGDGSDRMDGESGSDTIEVNGAPGAGDAFTLQPSGGRARFDRTNLGPFTLDIGSSEALDLRGLGGDDSFLANAGTEAVVGTLKLDGGSGNDTLTGGGSTDIVSGGPGNDVLDGGGGADSVHGGDGDDVLALRDGAADLGVCGLGSDRATADAVGVDALVECEQVDQPPAAAVPVGDTVATALAIRSTSGRISRRARRPTVSIAVNCPTSEPGGCRGTLTLTTLRAVAVGRVRAVVVLGTAGFALRSGETRTLRVRLATGAARLARGGRLRARVRTVSRDAAGNVAESTRSYTITVRR